MTPLLPAGWIDDAYQPEDFDYDISQRRSAQATAQRRCACGRFAKFVRFGGDQMGNVWEVVLCSVHGTTVDAR